MDWKTNHLLLAEKLIKAIDKEGELSLDAIDARSIKHGIDMRVLDKALEVLHRNKHIDRRVKQGTVYYRIKVVKPVTPASHLAWVREHYPWPKEFVMPFPEWDLSFLFLTPAEYKQYKIELKGGYNKPHYGYTRGRSTE